VGEQATTRKRTELFNHEGHEEHEEIIFLFGHSENFSQRRGEARRRNENILYINIPTEEGAHNIGELTFEQ